MIQRLINLHFSLRFCQYAIIAAFILTSCQGKAPVTGNSNATEIPSLIYTKHARCRMDCRHINETEIKEVLLENHINERKSDPNGTPCPTFAYEGYTNEQQHLRIVIAKCSNSWKVVTCIDLGNDFECNCH